MNAYEERKSPHSHSPLTPFRIRGLESPDLGRKKKTQKSTFLKDCQAKKVHVRSTTMETSKWGGQA